MPLSKSIKILFVVYVINQRRCNEALFVFIELKYKDYSILRYSLFQSDVNAMYVFLFKMFSIWINLVKKYIVMNCKKISALVFLRTGRLLLLSMYEYTFICNCSRSIWKSRHMQGLNYIYLCRISQCCLFRKWLQLWIQNIRVRTTTNFLCFVCRSACYVIVYSSYINTFL